MYRVTKGNKIRNVVIGENKTKNFYEGEILPDNYIPHKSYIDNKIIEEIKEGVKDVKNWKIR